MKTAMFNFTFILFFAFLQLFSFVQALPAGPGSLMGHSYLVRDPAQPIEPVVIARDVPLDRAARFRAIQERRVARSVGDVDGQDFLSNEGPPPPAHVQLPQPSISVPPPHVHDEKKKKKSMKKKQTKKIKAKKVD
ncbi:uncharacterized protein EV420DRAFT_1554731 [Desarmillaria tabescens]|uniref:Uncharacterized protein n=1 Tax=Armillaria tabescens TaxID=1929756 RepID=A0AA39N274_ARMTA|nr:uncharacterized protein EV420DRAFT_1554731 [Desarmillaria tabescens]KAK0455207.1 hypothetical protein EV420DRAFT_1554731 [Desarmillaria tabescens]